MPCLIIPLTPAPAELASNLNDVVAAARADIGRDIATASAEAKDFATAEDGKMYDKVTGEWQAGVRDATAELDAKIDAAAASAQAAVNSSAAAIASFESSAPLLIDIFKYYKAKRIY